ncbi:uncharacterized protein LOC106157582 [Lingula anatina]|uniref:Uncharacterized protein LOC106157582 n=1 Tax=Lingula anatina TaxID=7574 RepID=A0A1S3HRT3_LINAN|nr:uncharacterized protein LOC106157582 [Lingula anatina]XP_013388740.1 uncharacterized protein LOC106157582 [Lingula anatina]XP_013388741.1 uncharacterized protein LOC106157582 [Lingula anatina]|eukprot:XP_013388739.1 uncharacterized protein LOC106157582 [Lingula anatina]
MSDVITAQPFARRPLGAFEQIFDAHHSFGNYIFLCAMFLRSKSKLTEAVLHQVLRKLQNRHPFLRSRIVVGDNGNRYFEEMDKLVVDFQMVESDDWEGMYEKMLTTQFDSENGPLWRVKLLTMPHTNEEAKCNLSNGALKSDMPFKQTILFAFHHAISDGISAASLFEEFAEILDSHQGSMATEHPVKSLPLLPPMEDLLPRPDITFRCLDFFNIFRIAYESFFPGKNQYLNKYPPPITKDPNVAIMTKVIPFELSKLETEKLIARCKKEKTSVHGALTTAANLALSKIIQPGGGAPLVIPSLHPVNIRYFCKPPVEPHHLGNLVLAVDTKLRIPKGTSIQKFWELSKKYTQAIRGGLASKEYTKFLRVFGKIWNRDMYISRVEDSQKVGGRNGAYFTLSNLGNLDRVLKGTSYSEIELEDVLTATGMHREGPVFLHNVITFRGQLRWHLNYCTNVATTQHAVEYSYLIHKTLLEALKE